MACSLTTPGIQGLLTQQLTGWKNHTRPAGNNARRYLFNISQRRREIITDDAVNRRLQL